MYSGTNATLTTISIKKKKKKFWRNNYLPYQFVLPVNYLDIHQFEEKNLAHMFGRQLGKLFILKQTLLAYMFLRLHSIIHYAMQSKLNQAVLNPDLSPFLPGHVHIGVCHLMNSSKIATISLSVMVPSSSAARAIALLMTCSCISSWAGLSAWWLTHTSLISAKVSQSCWGQWLWSPVDCFSSQ